MLTVSIGLAGAVVFLMYRHTKNSQRQSNLMLQAMVKSAQDMRNVGSKLNLVQETGMQSLVFQKKAFDHQRILVLSMNQQLKSIHKMLGADNAASTNVMPKAISVNSSAKLSRGTLANNLKSQTPKMATTHAGIAKKVVRLEDLFSNRISTNPSADIATENAVKMPTEQNASLIRRVVNG